MSAREPSTDEPTAPDAPRRRGHSPWLWVAIGLAVVAAGLLVWGIVTRSDLNDANAQLDSNAAAQTTAIAAAGKAYDEIADELGATQESLADAEQEVQDASAAAEQSQKQADAAKQQADSAQQQAQAAEEQAKAAEEDAKQAEQAQAERQQADEQQANAEEAAQKERDQAVDAAESKSEVVRSCAKAYAAALGSLFEGDSVKEQADAVRAQLQSIRADCSAALGGS
jgi:FtsZ-interacting cell division protein ZipA